MMQITDEEMDKLPFQSFHKVAVLQARPLTDADYQQKQGIIHTQEGDAPFQPGDYLAHGIQGEEWPITKNHFLAQYEQVSEPNAEGFASYRATDVRQAYQMTEAFTVKRANGTTLTGKAGDYLVRSGSRVWITDCDIFNKSYEHVS